MNIRNLATYLAEMAAPKKICPKCGHSMAGYHYQYKGEWRCKSSSLANPPPGFTPNAGSTTATPPSAPKPIASTPPTQVTTPATPQTPPKPTVPAASTPPVAPVTPAAATLRYDATFGDGEIKAKMEKYLNRYGITQFKINDDLSVDVFQDVNIGRNEWTEIPVKFGVVDGSFTYMSINLKSCVNFPDEVTGHLSITGCSITSLKGFPKKVGTGELGGSACISHNPIKSLDGISEEIGGTLYMAYTQIESLAGIHNKITKLDGKIDWTESPVTQNVMGIFEIPGVTGVVTDNQELEKILNQFFDEANPKDFFEIQGELFDNGFEDFADL